MEHSQPAVADYYDRIADTYDTEFVAKAEYQTPKIIRQTFKQWGISGGSVLDIGCGTGNLAQTLGPSFSFTGIEISRRMALKAVEKGYGAVHQISAEEMLPRIPMHSFDHVVALSSLYFIKDILTVIENARLIARKSIFVSLERFDEETRKEMSERGMTIFNHGWQWGADVTLSKVHLWTRPSNGKRINGDIVLKIIR